MYWIIFNEAPLWKFPIPSDAFFDEGVDIALCRIEGVFGPLTVAQGDDYPKYRLFEDEGGVVTEVGVSPYA